MKVSIITTCYNREKTIGDAIESVLNQDYPDIEYIVIDGKSKDGSMEVVNRYSGRIDKIVSEPDNGVYQAINKGIRLATGDIVGLLHSDDFLYDSHIISEIVKAFESENVDFVYGDGLFVDKNDTDRVVRNWIGGTYKPWKVHWGWLPLHPTCYIKKSVIDKMGLYNEKFRIASDTEFLVRYLKDGVLKVKYLEKYIVKMRMGGLSTDPKKLSLMWKEDTQIYHNYGYHGHFIKVFKIMWKIPQFVSAKMISVFKGSKKIKVK